MDYNDISVVESKALSSQYEKRYVIVDKNSGKVLDDAQGYGYKSKQNAYSSYAYKHRDKKKDREKKAKERHIKAWLKEHKDFAKFMDQIAFEIAKGSWGPDEKFDAKQVKQMLKNCGLEPDFTAVELLKVWRKM